MTITTPRPAKPDELEHWPVLEDDPEDKDEDDHSLVCHIGLRSRNLCGRTGHSIQIDQPGANLAGPICDGRDGCGGLRCPRCAAIWKGGHGEGRR